MGKFNGYKKVKMFEHVQIAYNEICDIIKALFNTFEEFIAKKQDGKIDLKP